MSVFGAKSTAEEVVQGHDLSGKVMVVTGGNVGIGYETVKALAGAGAHVVMCSRNVEAGKAAAETMKSPEMKGKVTVEALDLADFQSIKAFADSISSLPRLDVLICNGGIMACPLMHTKQGFEQQIGVNHIGHFYLTQLLLPKLKASGTTDAPARVVVVASLNYVVGSIEIDDLNFETRKYQRIKAYSDSKLANILFSRELAARMKEEGAPVMSVSLHPGLVKSTLTRGLGFLGVITRFLTWMTGKTTPQGAATSVYAVVTTVGLESGSYLEDCAVKVPKEHAMDDEMAKKLWIKTEELVNKALEG